MTLQEILDKIKLHYPKAATWTDAQIVSLLNDEQREIFRQLQKTGIYEFETVANQPIYSLPTGCETEFIDYVGLTTDDPVTASTEYVEYTLAEANEDLQGTKYFDAYNGNIGIYPVPEATGYNVKIIYQKRPVLLSASNLTAVPELKEDWHRIFVYGAIAEIADTGSNPDITTANNYTVKYNALLEDIMLAKYNNKAHKKNVKDWTK